MKIKKYTIRDLKEELRNDSLWNKNLLPVTKQRVLSYIHNPNAKEDNLVLFVAYNNKDTIVGYIGVLPDRIFINNSEHTIAWATSWWVDPNYRNVGTGGFLLLTVLNHYNLATSGSTDSADKAYAASGKLSTLRTVEGIEFIVRSCSNYLLPKKFPKLNRLRPVLKCIDWTINMFVDPRAFFWKRNNALYKPASLEFITEIDKQTDQFIREHRRNELYTRNAAELNWIIKYPWILSAPCVDKTVSRYFFSSVSKRFFYLNIKVYDANDKMVGFVMLKVRDNVMSIPYLYSDSDALTNILYLIGFLIIELNIDIFITYNKEVLNNLTKIKFPYLYGKGRSKLYYISNKFKDVDFDDFVLQDGNGDAVFT